MTKMQQEQLARIYNTLLLISTKGEDTLIMAECLRAMQDMINAPMAVDSQVAAE